MKEYILMIVTMSFFAGLVLMITPQTSRGGERYVRLTVSLAMLALLLSPFVNFIKNIGDLSINYDSGNRMDSENSTPIEYDTWLVKASCGKICENIEEALAHDLNVSCRVSLDYEYGDGALRIHRVYVSAPEGGAGIREYIKLHYGLDSEITSK